MMSLLGKAIVLAVLIGASSAPAFASVTLFCWNTNQNDRYDNYHPINHQVLLKERVVLECVSHRLESVRYDNSTTSGMDVDFDTLRYDVEIRGTGFGFRFSAFEGISLLCPSVRRSALGVEKFTNKRGQEKDGVQEFYGAKASAGLLFGADAGVFANKNGGACILLGGQIQTAGFSVSGAKMTVIRND